MVYAADPVTQWAILILFSVVMGTALLIAVAFFRRWQQIRYARHLHRLQRRYRPALAKVLSGGRNPSAIQVLQELPLATLELVVDPLFSKRKLPECCLVFLQALCVELGLTDLWQGRLANGHGVIQKSAANGRRQDSSDRAILSHLLRAKSIRNLGILRHWQSWPHLVTALDDRHADIQLVALRSLASLGAPESFPALRERLHAVVQGKSFSPPPRALKAAMANFDLTCARALLPSLRQPDQQIRLHATEVLRTMVCREAARRPRLILTPESLTPELVELLLSALSADSDAEIRARTAEILVFLTDPRATAVLRGLLTDQQWFVRLRTVRSLAHFRQPVEPLHHDIRDRLSDLHWRVREAAIQTLISLGPEGNRHIYEHFLTSQFLAAHEQILEVMERRGLMPAFVEACCAGRRGVDALVDERAGGAASPGLPGGLDAFSVDMRQQSLDHFLTYARSRIPLAEDNRTEEESATDLSSFRPAA